MNIRRAKVLCEWILALLLIGLVDHSFSAPAVASERARCAEGGGIGGTGVTRDSGGIGGTGQTAEGGIAGTGQRAEGGIGGTGISPSKQSVRPVAGRVLFAKGSIEVQFAGKSRSLTKGDWVCEGDSLVSAKGALAQITMQDGGTLILRGDTQVNIEKFSFDGAADGTESLALFLVRGGFRAITGLIGKEHKENYRIRTETATINIRGTDHETFFVPLPTSHQKPDAEPGTYNHVISGGTSMRTDRGVISINATQVGFAPFKGVPRLIQTLPPFLNDMGKETSSRVWDRPKESNVTDNDIVQPVTIVNGLIDLGSFLGTLSESPLGSASVGVHQSSGSLTVGGLVTGTAGLTVLLDDAGLPAAISNDSTGYNYVANGAQLVDFGSAVVDSVNVIWGIYAGGMTFDNANNPLPVNFHHFALAAGGATPDQIISSVSGTAIFSNIVGFTKPTNELGLLGGNVTISTSIQLGASPAVTSYNIAVTDANSRSWSGTFAGSTSLTAFAQTGLALSVNCVGPQCGSGTGAGSATGILIGPNAKGLITSYGLATTSGQSVAGAAVLSRP